MFRLRDMFNIHCLFDFMELIVCMQNFFSVFFFFGFYYVKKGGRNGKKLVVFISMHEFLKRKDNNRLESETAGWEKGNCNQRKFPEIVTI